MILFEVIVLLLIILKYYVIGDLLMIILIEFQFKLQFNVSKVG